jgi:Tol biopolymer transport system component
LTSRIPSGRQVFVSLLLIFLVLVPIDRAEAAPGDTILVSQPSVAGTTTHSLEPAISGDGRYVAFASQTRFSGGDTNDHFDIYRRDVQSGTTDLVSYNRFGAASNGDSRDPSISADGRYVAFDSVASDLTANDQGNTPDVFVRDTQTGTLYLISRAADGSGPGNNTSLFPSISADGSRIAFESFARNLTSDVENFGPYGDVFVTGLSGEITRVDKPPLPPGCDSESCRPPPDSSVDWPRISADGSSISFTSGATNLVVGDTNGASDVFVSKGGVLTLASRSGDGVIADGASFRSAISGDGRYVAFTSQADNLTTDHPTTQQDAYLRDLVASTTTLVDRSVAGGISNNSAGDPLAISDDGRYVAFASAATDLVPDDTNGSFPDVFVRDMQGGTTLASRSSSGVAGDGYSVEPALSGDGRFVAFMSQATNLTADDGNGSVSDVFRHELAAAAPQPPEAPTLISPEDQANFTSKKVTFQWNAAQGADTYELVIDGAVVKPGITGTETTSDVEPGGHIWAVRAKNAAGETESESRFFKIIPGSLTFSDITPTQPVNQEIDLVSFATGPATTVIKILSQPGGDTVSNFSLLETALAKANLKPIIHRATVCASGSPLASGSIHLFVKDRDVTDHALIPSSGQCATATYLHYWFKGPITVRMTAATDGGAQAQQSSSFNVNTSYFKGSAKGAAKKGAKGLLKNIAKQFSKLAGEAIGPVIDFLEAYLIPTPAYSL